MPVALCAMSHSPLMGKVNPAPGVVAAVDEALERTRSFVAEFAPDLVVVFGPDHYNGFLYEVMPSFCIGAQADSIGDYGLPKGPLAVDSDTVRLVARQVLDSDVDLAYSERMQVDHGLVQSLVTLFGSLDSVPVVPVFINCVAEPLGPAHRAVALGRAVGEALADDDRRILFLASGGLSHDPPVPRLADATPEVAEKITVRQEVSAEARNARETRTIEAARAFAAGDASYQELNPAWDEAFLDACASGDLDCFGSQPVEWYVEQAGHSSHEVRTWLAAHAAMAVTGPYSVQDRFYRPIRDWFAGFGIMTSVPAGEAVAR